MSKLIISVVLLLLTTTVWSEDAIKWAGDTTGFFSKLHVPSVDISSGVCTASSATTATSYAKFTTTFDTAGVREVAAMAEKSFKSDIRIYVYNATFTPSSTCTNLFFVANEKQFSSQGGPVIDEFIHFEAHVTYTFVISSASTTSGLFAVNINPSVATGQLTMASPLWTPVEDYVSGGSCGVSSATPTQYGYYTWTQTTTGFFDVYALFDNPYLETYSSYIAIYRGAVNFTALQNDACNAGTLIQSGKQSSFGVYLPYINLLGGASYTVILSGGNNALGYWGIQVIPTRIRFFTNSPMFIQPARTNDLLCKADTSYVTAAWDAIIFTTEFGTYLIDTGAPPSPFSYQDTYSFFYSGNNPGSSSSAPSTCPTPLSLVSQGDTGDVTPVYASTSTGKNYTVVVSTYSGGQKNSDTVAYTLYLFTGRQVSEQNTASKGGAVISVVGLVALVTSLLVL